jgi:hypothetical protein
MRIKPQSQLRPDESNNERNKLVSDQSDDADRWHFLKSRRPAN